MLDIWSETKGGRGDKNVPITSSTGFGCKVWLSCQKDGNWTKCPVLLMREQSEMTWMTEAVLKAGVILLSKSWPSINTAFQHLYPVFSSQHGGRRRMSFSEHTKSPSKKTTSPSSLQWTEAESQNLLLILYLFPQASSGTLFYIQSFKDLDKNACS